MTVTNTTTKKFLRMQAAFRQGIKTVVYRLTVFYIIWELVIDAEIDRFIVVIIYQWKELEALLEPPPPSMLPFP